MADKKYKLSEDYWETSGVYDIGLSKTQRVINQEVNTKIGNTTMGTTATTLTGAIAEHEGDISSLNNAITSLGSDDIANDSTNVSGLKVTNALDTLNGAITSIENKINSARFYASVADLGLTGKPTIDEVANAMPSRSIFWSNSTDVDISALENSSQVTVFIIIRYTQYRTFAIGSRTGDGVDSESTANLFWATFTGSTWAGFYNLRNPTTEPITASNITSGVSVTCRKKGNIVRLDCGIASGSKVSFASGTTTFANLPADARPPANVYFPVMVRLDGQSAFDSTPRYGAVFTNGNVAINSTGLTNVVQMVFGQTYFTN